MSVPVESETLRIRAGTKVSGPPPGKPATTALSPRERGSLIRRATDGKSLVLITATSRAGSK